MGEAIIVRTDDGRRMASVYASYQAFCANVNIDSLDAALGKGNIDKVQGIGLALAMYAKFKNDNIDINISFPNLIKCDTVADIYNKAYDEVNNNQDLFDLFNTVKWASILSEKGAEVANSGIFDLSQYGIFENDVYLDICVIGGGGGGGAHNGQDGACGGGAGGFMQVYNNILYSEPIVISIGAGGINGNAGGVTTVLMGINLYSAMGGGAGQSPDGRNGGAGGDGGTGGGGAGGYYSNVIGGAGGTNGGNGETSQSSVVGGLGDGLSKHLFGNPTLPIFCGGGGGGVKGVGGIGGGGDGGDSTTFSGKNGTLYGAGGGGACADASKHGCVSGNGYQGAVFIRVHRE